MQRKTKFAKSTNKTLPLAPTIFRKCSASQNAYSKKFPAPSWPKTLLAAKPTSRLTTVNSTTCHKKKFSKWYNYCNKKA